LLIVILGQRVVNVVPLYMNGLVKVGQPNSVEWDTVPLCHKQCFC